MHSWLRRLIIFHRPTSPRAIGIGRAYTLPATLARTYAHTSTRSGRGPPSQCKTASKALKRVPCGFIHHVRARAGSGAALL